MPHRYFTTDISGGTAVLSGADAHHLAHVMRARPGETVTLCDGKGTDYACAVRGFGPDTVELEILSSCCQRIGAVAYGLRYMWVTQSRISWRQIIQKAVELGAVRDSAVFQPLLRGCAKKGRAEKPAL